MPIVDKLSLKSNPFEHYTAEKEPHISEYAVRPPYLRAITQRASALNTFILFGCPSSEHLAQNASWISGVSVSSWG